MCTEGFVKDDYKIYGNLDNTINFHIISFWERKGHFFSLITLINSMRSSQFFVFLFVIHTKDINLIRIKRTFKYSIFSYLLVVLLLVVPGCWIKLIPKRSFHCLCKNKANFRYHNCTGLWIALEVRSKCYSFVKNCE